MSETALKKTSSDPRVAAAIAHWAPRFVSNGVLLADFEEVTAGIERWEDWCRAWCERAKVHEGLGREALAQGHKLSAGEHLVRAGVYYHFAKFVFVHDPKQMREAHMRFPPARPARKTAIQPSGFSFGVLLGGYWPVIDSERARSRLPNLSTCSRATSSHPQWPRQAKIPTRC